MSCAIERGNFPHWKGSPAMLTPEEAEARQRAAGPDLYLALRRLLIECGEGSGQVRVIDLLSRDTIELAERAMRKADGAKP
jgi:hypothetical protein